MRQRGEELVLAPVDVGEVGGEAARRPAERDHQAAGDEVGRHVDQRAGLREVEGAAGPGEQQLDADIARHRDQRGERDGEQRNAEMAERHGEGKIRSADTVCGGGRG